MCFGQVGQGAERILELTPSTGQQRRHDLSNISIFCQLGPMFPLTRQDTPVNSSMVKITALPSKFEFRHHIPWCWFISYYIVTVLRYTTLRYATLRCAALRCAALRCAALRCAALRYATTPRTVHTIHIMCNIITCHTIVQHILSLYIV